MASKIRNNAGKDVLQYLVNVVGNLATLTPSRDFAVSQDRVVTALGARTLAHTAIANKRSAQSTYSIVEGLEDVVITVPASYLKLDHIEYRIASDGEAMKVRKSKQAATIRYEKAAANLARTFGFKGF